MTRPLRLSLNMSGVGRHTAAWTHPTSTPGAELDIDHFVGITQLAEEGLFDAVFLADSPALGTDEHRFPPEAILADRVTGRYFAPEALPPGGYRGTHHRVAGPLNLPTPPGPPLALWSTDDNKEPTR
ncbi:hypothetical protein [Streptomyces sp. NBRC 109706]|uniref:hypothetical protein n=1 Tax=Streptomyces sp. NBRC 109706 TaxID=1550035 RepID=UPI00078675ED|nr:hypothetical protein [Streptomyces sp. NBRC 109706]